VTRPPLLARWAVKVEDVRSKPVQVWQWIAPPETAALPI